MRSHFIHHDKTAYARCVNKAVEILKKGCVVAHATETCYGFACDIFNKTALKRLYRLKQMDERKPVSIMVSDLKMAKRYGVFTKKALRFAKKYWPGPLTIIVKKKKAVPIFLNPRVKNIGIRFPDHALSQDLVNKMGRPLATTSANISGKPSPYSTEEIKKQFAGKKVKPDFIIDFGRIPKNPPSTIIDISGKEEKMIRQGEMAI